MKRVGLVIIFAVMVMPVFGQDVATSEVSDASTRAATIVLLAGAVASIVQGVKKLIERLAPGVSTTAIGIGLNVVLTLAGAVAAVPPENLFTPETILGVLSVIFSAAGIHGLLGRKVIPSP